MPYKGVLDHLDRIAKLIETLEIHEGMTTKEVRKEKAKVVDLRSVLNEARRMIERAGQETPT